MDSDSRPLPPIAYFTMEVGLDPSMRTYSGGLGVLAGDTLRAAADLGVPMVCVTLAHRKGHFRQMLDADGNQTEEPAPWRPEEILDPVPARVTLTIAGRPVRVRAWRHTLWGTSGKAVPVYFLDTDLPENGRWARSLTDRLYIGDARLRLCQEALLGLGGVAMLRALGHADAQVYHMNEGHSALLTLAILEEEVGGRGLAAAGHEEREAVRRRCVFTTHTPVAAGHDQFPMSLAREVLGGERAAALVASGSALDDTLNMTYLGLFFSRYVNGVSMRHVQVSRGMFPAYPINSVTNGVHAATWVSPPFRRLFDEHIPDWRTDNLYLRHAFSISLELILEAHAKAKASLLEEVRRRGGATLRPEVFTIGFARRATPYKRADLLFTDLDRLRRIARGSGGLQVLYAGKAHPNDEGGKSVIRHVHHAATALGDDVPVVYLEDYDMGLAGKLCAGVDLWLNTPLKPLEASGTSGMKAALNGVPSLSVLDGWWIEGHIEGVTGWSIGDMWSTASDPEREVASLYDKLENVILPLHLRRPEEYALVMRSAIMLNGSFFNAQRMLAQYVRNAYYRTG